MSPRAFCYGLALGAAMLSLPAQAGDVAKGKVLAEKVCAACHGLDGNSQVPSFPKIAGQHEDYLVHALKEYKSGKRKDPVMASMATPLSKQDIADLAAYYSAQQGLKVVKR